MKLPNLIIFLAIALCVALFLGLINDLSDEVLELKEGYRVQGEEIMALRGLKQLNNENAERAIGSAQWTIDEVRKIVTVTYSKFIPIDGGWLAIREEEEKDDNKD